MRTFIVIFFLLHAQNVIALNFGINSHIVHEINEASNKADIGIKIRNLKTGKIIYQLNEDRYYTFASSLKIITVFSLQKYFGSDHLFSSKLSKKNHNYYLDINDPDFSTEDLELLISRLKETKTTEIEGDFYIVDNKFTVPAMVDGRMIDDSYYCYGAPITKVHIDRNCMKFYAKPSMQLRELIYLEDKGLIPYKIVNKAYTIPANDWPRIKTIVEEDKLIVLGTLNRSSERITVGAVINNSIEHIKNMVREILLRSNIILKGQILSSGPASAADLVATVDKSFDHISSKALKISDNFITDYLLAEFGTKYAANDWRNCGNLLKQLVLQEFNVDLSRSTITDGSGLSLYNMLTVNQFDEFLSSLYNSPKFKTFLPMMAMPGEIGTLKNRFKDTKIFAKSDSMTGISSLVGYVFDSNNAAYSFVIVSNNFYGSGKKSKELQEAIVKYIIK